MTAPAQVARAIESAVRRSYGRLVAIVASRSRDVDAAEDALAGALEAALVAWPRDGVPANPEAWLVTAARRRRLDGWRQDAMHERAHAEIAALAEEAVDDRRDAWPDGRLGLMAACTHPAIDEAVRAPLMLQVVLGLPVERIAGVFVCAPATLGQRLARAKRKLKHAGVPFELPPPELRGERLDTLLDAIYAAYGTAWIETQPGLAAEAGELADAVVALAPDEPEPLGLAALIRHCEARTAARRDADGRYVPLSAQDTTRWDAVLCDDADALLVRAARAGRPGPYQLEAAIQSAHASRRHGRAAPPAALLALYDRLVALRPRLGALVGRACVLADASDAAAGLAALDAIADRAGEYGSWWAARAELAARAGRTADALVAYDRAIALAEDAASRDYLGARRARTTET